MRHTFTDILLNKTANTTRSGHSELIIYPIDHKCEILVFDSLFYISQHMWGITNMP